VEGREGDIWEEGDGQGRDKVKLRVLKVKKGE
jgi:hypothetical protein